MDVDLPSHSTGYPGASSFVTTLPFWVRVLESYHVPQSRAMSGSSVDDGAESDQYMSLPATPTADGGDTFWAGELCHWFDMHVAYRCDGP